MTIETVPRRYVVEYQLDYKHRVQVGVMAGTADEAQELAKQAFDAGAIWDDTAEMPLLFDDYEEDGDGPLLFQVVATVKEWPAPDASVAALRRNGAAMLCARFLVDAVNAAMREGKQVDWNKAYGAALAAVGQG